MKINIKPEWVLRMAEKGGDGFVSVGGFLCHGLADLPATPPSADRLALAKLIEFQRRKLRLTVEQVAAKADLEIEDVLALEDGIGAIEPRTIFKVADYFRLPLEKLKQLAGLVKQRNADLDRAAVRFAARSAPIEDLSPEEAAALDEFVQTLAD